MQKGEDYLTRALTIREGLVPGSSAVAASLGLLGKAYRLRGELTKAEEYYRRALSITEKLDASSLELARLLLGLAAVAEQRNDLPDAENYYRRALLIMQKVDPEGQDYAETLAELAGVVRQEGDLDGAAQLYRQALANLENKAIRVGGIQQDKSRYRGMHDRYYREYLDLLMEEGQVDLAFQVLDSSRSRTLLESLVNGNVEINGGVESAFGAGERALQRLLNIKSQQRVQMLGGKHTDGQLQAINAEIGELLYEYQQLRTETEAKNPKYAQLIHPQELSATEIQQLLDDDTLLLEYALGERSFVWLVARDSIKAYELPRRDEIEGVAHRVYELLRDRNGFTAQGHTERQIRARRTRIDSEYSTVAKELSRMIFGPIANRLERKRLLIVSDGALQYIPFSALPTPGVTNPTDLKARSMLDHRKVSQAWAPLIVEHEIVNLPSASILDELRRQKRGRRSPPKAVAVLADPVFDQADERVAREKLDKLPTPKLVAAASSEKSGRNGSLTRSADDLGLTRDGDFYLSRLLSTRQEADSIMAATPKGGRLKAVDFHASRELAISGVLAQYKIVHFATHGFLDSKHPELSGLILSLVNKQGKPLNGFLDLQDIYSLNLPVDLVVLSACETGLGQEISGEGLIGLTRGFMYAGATRVVASLWSVSDEATAELMARFYRLMQVNKMRPAAALRASQIAMWQQDRWKSPYYWAAFQIQGDWK